jgi:hypothetical protein
VRPVGLNQEFVARREVVPQRGVGHPDRLADRPQRRPVHPALREQRDRAVQDLLPASHAFRVRAVPWPACVGVGHPAIVGAVPAAPPLPVLGLPALGADGPFRDIRANLERSASGVTPVIESLRATPVW